MGAVGLLGDEGGLEPNRETDRDGLAEMKRTGKMILER